MTQKVAQKQVTIDPAFIAKLFNIDESDIKSFIPTEFWRGLTFTELDAAEVKFLVREVKERTSSDSLRVVGANNNNVWEKGWGEIFDHTNSAEFHPNMLAPQYFQHHTILRFCGNYIKTKDTQFIYNFDQILRRAIFYKYLRGSQRIIEFGCGTGNSQLILAELFPDVDLVATDWTQASLNIVNKISTYLNRSIATTKFNLLNLDGWDKLSIDNNTSILTVHALEQVGDNNELLLTKLVEAKPKLCVHVEPIVDYYDESNDFDKLAINYHQKRNYLSNWVPRIRNLVKQGKAEIIDEQRLGFGDRYHEAYSILVWRPY
jgi:hypothetical protein